MSPNIEPIKNHNSFNKAAIARQIGVSRVYVSKVMRGLVKNDKVLNRIKNYIHEISRAA